MKPITTLDPNALVSKPRKRKNVRTACATCKKRHLKCDESKPSCARCIAARWPCDYVEPGPIVRKRRNKSCSNAATSLSLHRPEVIDFRSPDEKTSFGYFHAAGTNCTASLFSGETWWNQALRTSVYEPAVRYAIEALGLQLHDLAIQHQSRREISTWSLARYTESITAFNKGVLYPLEQERTTIVLCLLFVTIELLCNNLDIALDHLRGGLRIAAALTSKANSIDRSDGRLFHALVHLQAQGRIHSSPILDFDWTTAEVDLSSNGYPTTFLDAGEARDELDSISASNYSVLSRWNVSLHSGLLSGPRKCADTAVLKWHLNSRTSTEIEDFKSDLTILKERLSSWHTAFLQLERSSLEDIGNDFNVRLAILKTQYCVLFIVMNTVSETGESCYDAFEPEFQEIVSLAERILDTQVYQQFSFFFSSSPLLATLFFTAMKCRVTRIQQHALRLLRLCPQREGFWHRESLLRLVQWKFAREGNIQHSLLTERQQTHDERTKKAERNRGTLMRRTYELGGREDSEVWNVKEDGCITFEMRGIL